MLWVVNSAKSYLVHGANLRGELYLTWRNLLKDQKLPVAEHMRVDFI